MESVVDDILPYETEREVEISQLEKEQKLKSINCNQMSET